MGTHGESESSAILVVASESHTSKLCADCHKLDLTAEKFVVEYTSISSTMRQQYLENKMNRRSPRFSPKSRNSKLCLGNLRDIITKSQNCPFCKLVRNSLVLSDYGPYLDAKCDMIWELDGREIDGRHGALKARTRRIHLLWDHDHLRNAYLVFVAPERYVRFSSDASGAWEKRAFSLGRNIESSSNIFLMKSWFDACSREHGGECRPIQNYMFAEMARQSFFGVIDVLDMCLKPLPLLMNDGKGRYEPYVALSYVWGNLNSYTTKLSNILTHKIPGSLAKYLAELPQVIRDAMFLVTQLGQRYLWVDSLCIVQDSLTQWKLNAEVMDLIYGNALLTICAADGSDSGTALKAMHPEQRSSTQHIEECAPGVSLMLRELPEVGIGCSTWNTRAWTFQERLLSRRCLIFAEGRVFFQCRSNAMSEDLVTAKAGSGWSLDRVQALPRILRELPRRGFRVYMNCVLLYSSRALTKKKDILSAFKGISNLIGENMESPFVFGLPCSHFDLALLWQPSSKMKRRKPRTEEDMRNPDEMAFPSWSWCGWEDSQMQYKNEMLEDCLTNVQEWLQDHTWISWYIRDGRGNLRPLWNKYESRGNRETEERWRGYEVDKLTFDNGARNPRHSNPIRQHRDVPSEIDIRIRSRARERTPQSHLIIRERGRDASLDPHTYEGGESMRGDAPQVRNVHERTHREYSAAGRHEDQTTDFYGRLHHWALTSLRRHDFEKTLPESPYKVLLNRNPEPDREFPDQPYLQFFTWTASLYLDPKEKSDDDKVGEEGLCRCDIADNNGDWCGSIVLDEQWLTSRRELEGSKFEFLALSDAKGFTPEECEVWTYYTPQEWSLSEWDLYYVLLVERLGPIWSRVGLGKVFRDAFTHSPCDWKEIILG